jgi:hypothetical protein
VNGNGSLDAGEVTLTQNVCSGVAGADGATGATGPIGPQGQTGATGKAGTSSLVSTSTITAGAVCPAGGVQITIGVDANGDGIIGLSEITSQQNICNGVGTNGGAQLINTAAIGSGAVCATGGVTIATGFDTNGNGALEGTEVTSTQNVCNGAVGATGATGGAGPTGGNGAAGAKGGCTSFGGGASFLSLFGLLGRARRRRKVAA